MVSSSLDSTAISSTNQHQEVDDDGCFDDDGNILQKHASFFDRNKDGLVYPWETFQGFRAIGSGILLSTLASIFINASLSAKTRPGKCPNLLFPIEVKNIKKAKHGSDSGVYDTQGRFVASKFEEIFRKYAVKHEDALTSEEVMTMVKGNREPKDYSGWLQGFLEWKILIILFKDKNGLLSKDTIRGVFDGTLFEQTEKKRTSAAK